MKKKISKIPKFKNLEEEAKFWDTHSFTDFEDELEEVDLMFDLEKEKTNTLVVRVQKKFKESLEKIAMKKGLNVSTLARMWLIEKLNSQKEKYSDKKM